VRQGHAVRAGSARTLVSKHAASIVGDEVHASIARGCSRCHGCAALPSALAPVPCGPWRVSSRDVRCVLFPCGLVDIPSSTVALVVSRFLTRSAGPSPRVRARSASRSWDRIPCRGAARPSPRSPSHRAGTAVGGSLRSVWRAVPMAPFQAIGSAWPAAGTGVRSPRDAWSDGVHPQPLLPASGWSLLETVGVPGAHAATRGVAGGTARGHPVPGWIRRDTSSRQRRSLRALLPLMAGRDGWPHRMTGSVPPAEGVRYGASSTCPQTRRGLTSAGGSA